MSKATQKDELGKEELLKWLDVWKDASDLPPDKLIEEEKQAYAQLRKIVEQHFAEQSGEVDGDILIGRIGWMVSEISQRRVMTDVELKDIERIKQLLTQQPVQVDEEKIEAIVDMIDFSILPRRWSKKDIELVVWYTAKELLTRQPQKRVVTREWIEKELNAHLRLEDEALRDYVHVIADIIVEIFTAFGIEVVEEK